MEIIEEIRQLSPAERDKVNAFVRENLEPGQLSAEQLGELTRKMVKSSDATESGAT